MFKDVVRACQQQPSDVNFNKLHSYFADFIKVSAYGWYQNKNIACLYEFDDLVQEFTHKLWALIPKFKIKERGSDKENEKIFGGMLKVAIRNRAIDIEYHGTRPIRYPEGGPVHISQVPSEKDECTLNVPGNPKVVGEYESLIERVAVDLDGDALVVFKAKARGHKETHIAFITGISYYHIKTLVNGPIARAVEKAVGGRAG